MAPPLNPDLRQLSALLAFLYTIPYYSLHNIHYLTSLQSSSLIRKEKAEKHKSMTYQPEWQVHSHRLEPSLTHLSSSQDAGDGGHHSALLPPYRWLLQELAPFITPTTSPKGAAPLQPRNKKRAPEATTRSSNEDENEANLPTHPSLNPQLFPISSFALWGSLQITGLKHWGPSAKV